MARCEYCGGEHEGKFNCPRIDEIEYYKDGSVKRIIFKDGGTDAVHYIPVPYPEPVKPYRHPYEPVKPWTTPYKPSPYWCCEPITVYYGTTTARTCGTADS